MSEFVSLKVRLYPTGAQRQLLAHTFGCCRLVYNTALAKRIDLYDNQQRKTNAMDYIYQLPKLKEKFPWLRDVDSQALQQALRDMDVAYKNFFEGRGYPKFKSKHDRQSFRSTQHNWIKEDRLKIGKSGVFKFKGLNERYNGEKIRNITVSKDKADRYFASILIEKDNTVYDHCHEFLRCGIDVGVAVPYTIGWEDNKGRLKSRQTGRVMSTLLRIKEQRRKRYQRVLARKQKGSKNREKARIKLAKAFAKERDFRETRNKQLAVELAKKFTEIKFENLKIQSRTKAVKKKEDGTDRKGVKAKSGLNREMLRLGWGQFRTFLTQKAEQYGAKVLQVDARYTSQTCSACNHTEKANRKTQARFKCMSCGFTENADVNASWNIMRRPAVA